MTGRQNLTAARDFGRLLQHGHYLQSADSTVSLDDILLLLDVNQVDAAAQPKKITISGLANSVQEEVLSDVNSIVFNADASVSVNTAEIAWNNTEGTLDIGSYGITYQVGQELSFRCKNVSQALIEDGTAVMFAGADPTTGYIQIVPMIANGTVPGYVFFGVTTEPIPVNNVGFVTTLGKVRGLDTSSYPQDSLLWLDPTNPGGYTTVEPEAPNLKIAVAAVLKSDAAEGVLFVRAETGRNISDCHDVEVGTGAQDQEYLGWSEANQRWQPARIPNSAPRSITVAGPQINDSFTLFRTDRETTITNVVGIVAGASPSVTYEIRYALDRSTSGTLATQSATVTNTTTGSAASLQNQPIPAEAYVWVEITNVSGTVEEFNVSVVF